MAVWDHDKSVFALSARPNTHPGSGIKKRNEREIERERAMANSVVGFVS